MSLMGEERIEKGLVISPGRKVLKVGGSLAITLPKEWVKIQKWLGREVSELASVGDEVVILVPPEKLELAKEILLRIEEELKRYGRLLESDPVKG